MTEPLDITVEILRQIRDEIVHTRADLGARIDQTNARIDELRTRVDAIEERLGKP